MAVRSHDSGSLGGAPSLNGAAGKPQQKLKITAQEKKRFEALVRNAGSLAEVQKLEKMFQEGRLPRGVGEEEGGDDAMDET